MATIKTARRYFVAKNIYRTSRSDGSANTWRVYECHDQAQQRRILRDGLPVRDAEFIDTAGCRQPCCSTKGIRAATATEIRRAKAHEDCDRIPLL